MSSSDTKVCCKCKLEKPRTDYCRESRAPDGLSYYCRKCNNERANAHKKQHPEKYNIYQNKYHKKRWEASKKVEALEELINNIENTIRNGGDALALISEHKAKNI